MNSNIRPTGNAAQSALQRVLTTAVEHIGAGRLDQAVAALEAGGGAALKNPVGRNILGDIRLKQGRPREALKDFDTALAMAPTFPEAHCNRGVALQELGRLDDALAAEDRALRHRRDYATAHFNRGNILRDLGRTGEAVEAFGRALRHQPRLAEALVNRGNLVLDMGQAHHALKDFRDAVRIRPDYVAAHVGVAMAECSLGNFDLALAALDTVHEFAPDSRTVLTARSNALLQARRFGEALAVADELVAGDAADAAGHVARAMALRKLKRFEDGYAAAAEAVRLSPEDGEVQLVLASLAGDLGLYDQRWEALGRAEGLGVRGHELQQGRGIALGEFGRYDEAIAAFDRALAIEPENAATHHFRSFVKLIVGDFAEGWREHEWRLKSAEFNRPEMLGIAPLWGGEEVAGKKVVLYSEQGHGDTIQFVRYAPMVAARGAHVTLLVHEALRRLFAANFPDMDVTEALAMRRGFDYQAPIMSLPHILGTTSEAAIPRDVPYLAADPERVAKWRDRLSGEGFRIGISWQGSLAYLGDRLRSIPLTAFAPLAQVPGVRLISLQAQQGLEQLDTLPSGMEVERLGEEIVANPDGFREMAAVMANLDLLITSDSGPAHLAGALGRPVWVALRDNPDWRWMTGRSDSPWYPTMRLFRQKTPGDWAGVFDDIAAALADLVTGRAAR